MVVGKVAEGGNMFGGEHRAIIESADEVCRVSGTCIGLDIPTEKLLFTHIINNF